MLNQGAVEQVLVDYLRNKNVYVERHKEAKTLHLLPVDMSLDIACTGFCGLEIQLKK
jgi:hypothetical protein